MARNEPPSAARSALLNGAGARAPTRVLGAAAAASLETPETRPLDNEGVMQLQQQYMDDQDTKLEALTAALRRQRHLGELINQELALQEEVLDQLETGTDRVQGKIKDANKQLKRL
jgi:regulator of vacuolar morphogenesis